MAQLKNWEHSRKPQRKSKKTPRKLQSWLAAHKVLVEKLRKGINQEESKRSSFVLYGV